MSIFEWLFFFFNCRNIVNLNFSTFNQCLTISFIFLIFTKVYKFQWSISKILLKYPDQHYLKKRVKEFKNFSFDNFHSFLYFKSIFSANLKFSTSLWKKLLKNFIKRFKSVVDFSLPQKCRCGSFFSVQFIISWNLLQNH